jgi:hypothetical protein
VLTHHVSSRNSHQALRRRDSSVTSNSSRSDSSTTSTLSRDSTRHNRTDFLSRSARQLSRLSNHMISSTWQKLPIIHTKWKKARGIYGWRMGVLTGFCTAIFVLCANIALLIGGALSDSGYQSGISELILGNDRTVARWTAAYHALINILSTLLLCASNYTMQVLSSPTRQEVNEVHARGQWLDIGILSTRNLSKISKKRRILWWILGASSVPLHLL